MKDDICGLAQLQGCASQSQNIANVSNQQREYASHICGWQSAEQDYPSGLRTRICQKHLSTHSNNDRCSFCLEAWQSPRASHSPCDARSPVASSKHSAIPCPG